MPSAWPSRRGRRASRRRERDETPVAAPSVDELGESAGAHGAAMESGSLPVVRVADDGELADVRQLLEQLGVDWVSADEAPERATALVIANPRRTIGGLCGNA